MSSTNRGSKRSEADFYETPQDCTRLILPHLDWSGVQSVVDPCAGRGAILQAVSQYAPQVRCGGIELDLTRSLECTALGFPCVNGDAIETGAWAIPPVDLVIMNPPFSLAIKFCLRALRELRPSGTAVALMRLSMLAGKLRRQFWLDHPADVYVLERRPSFAKVFSWEVISGKGKTIKRIEGPFQSPGDADRALQALRDDTRFDGLVLRSRRRTTATDSSEYAFFVWGPGRGGRWCRLPGPGLPQVGQPLLSLT